MKYIAVLSLLFFCSCQNKTKDEVYFESIKSNDISLSTPKEGEWLYEHKEAGQTFEQYKNVKKNHYDTGKNILYLKPIGTFTNIQKEALELTRQYLEIFFQRRTILLNSVSDNIIPKFARRKKGTEQLLAPYILDSVLIKKLPENSVALMAITEKDLYPKPEWNYVFGLASYHKRVGVSSIYRLQNQHLDKSNFYLCLRRLINISSHEIGHMMSLHHCINAKCIMNGSNNLSETDTQPNRLCSECHQKLSWNLKYNNETRLKQLYLFFKKNQLSNDSELLKLDINQLYE